jgi:MoaA/NifB/PqqE/SkfB family radical SAM enzyme
MKSALDQRFIEIARQAGKQTEMNRLQSRQRELEKMLKNQLSQEQYELILEWEEIFNYRNTLEKKWLYFAGLKDGMQLLRELNNPS